MGQSSLNLNHLPRLWPFLEEVFHTEESKPDYICIDKACNVLKTAIRNGSWEQSVEKRQQDLLLILIIISTIMIQMNFVKHGVILHQLMVSAPNLVIKGKDKQGKMCFRCAFNTQVS